MPCRARLLKPVLGWRDVEQEDRDERREQGEAPDAIPADCGAAAAGHPARLRRAPVSSFYARKTARPGKLASSPRASSIRSSWLYLATRSERDGAPVLICPQP